MSEGWQLGPGRSEVLRRGSSMGTVIISKHHCQAETLTAKARTTEIAQSLQHRPHPRGYSGSSCETVRWREHLGFPL